MKATALGCYGQTQPTSPFLDRIAKQGAQFQQCHVTHTKCVPSRASLLTAQYPHVNGHRTLALETRPHEIHLIRQLKDHGYETALVGKNHVVDKQTMPQTFDHHLGGKGKATMEGDGQMAPGSYYVGQDTASCEAFLDTTYTDTAIDWVTQRDTEKPFFMWLNWKSPHPPYTTPAPYFGKLDRDRIELPPKDRGLNKPSFQKMVYDTYGLDAMTDAQWRELRATYLEMCLYIDGQVQRMYEALEKIGQLENTIIVFWSDHGDFAGEHQLTEKWDTCFYDCLTRVPLIIDGPGITEPCNSNALVESIDILPTVLDLVDVPIPLGVQGRSFVPILTGQATEHRDLVFCQGGQEPALLALTVKADAKPRPCQAYQLKQKCLENDPNINLRAKMIRDHRYKYCYRQQGPEELYDLQQDPWELVNIASEPEHRDLLDTYRLKMLDKLIEAETVEPYQNFLEA